MAHGSPATRLPRMDPNSSPRVRAGPQAQSSAPNFLRFGVPPARREWIPKVDPWLRSSVRYAEMAELAQLIDSEVFLAYATYTTIVLLKMMLMSVTTAFFRITRKAFSNPEDTVTFGKGENAKKYLRTDPDVERVRRGHLNDLENIVPFIGIGLLYALSGPALSTALLHFRIFVGARIFHTIAYLTPLPQPSRGLSWAAGYAVTISMAYRVLTTGLYL